jgi:hypothetical protein
VHGLVTLSSPDAFGAVLANWDAPGQHRDVHAAMAGMLAGRLDVPGVPERFAAQLRHPAVREREMAARPGRAAVADALRCRLAHMVATAETDTARDAARALSGPVGAAPVRDVIVAAVADSGRPYGCVSPRRSCCADGRPRRTGGRRW